MVNIKSATFATSTVVFKQVILTGKKFGTAHSFSRALRVCVVGSAAEIVEGRLIWGNGIGASKRRIE